MATTTTNYGLTKPATTEAYNIAIPNNNMDIIDAAMKAIDEIMAFITVRNGRRL